MTQANGLTTVIASQAWGGGIAIDGSVTNGIFNAGDIILAPTTCEDTLCASGSGIGAFGAANISGGITNNGLIDVVAFGNSIAAGIQLFAVSDGGVISSPTLSGGITNGSSGVIDAEGNGIYIAGATVNGNILNDGAIIGDSGIFISASAAELGPIVDSPDDQVVGIIGDGEDAQGNDVDEVGPAPTVINGDIINTGTITGLQHRRHYL